MKERPRSAPPGPIPGRPGRKRLPCSNSNRCRPFNIKRSSCLPSSSRLSPALSCSSGPGTCTVDPSRTMPSTVKPKASPNRLSARVLLTRLEFGRNLNRHQPFVQAVHLRQLALGHNEIRRIQQVLNLGPRTLNQQGCAGLHGAVEQIGSPQKVTPQDCQHIQPVAMAEIDLSQRLSHQG